MAAYPALLVICIKLTLLLESLSRDYASLGIIAVLSKIHLTGLGNDDAFKVQAFKKFIVKLVFLWK